MFNVKMIEFYKQEDTSLKKKKIIVTQKQIRSFYSRWLLNHSYSKKSRPLPFYLAETTG